MNSSTTTTPQPTLKLEREFHATPEKLWGYWTDPKKYAKWFNPAPIDLVIHEFDVRPGGKIRFDMPQPDGNQNPQTGVFHSLTPYTEIVTGEPDRSFLLTARFTPVGERQTRLTIEVVGVPPEWHAMATVGWNQGFDKLESELSTPEGGFTLVRDFKAAPEKVWTMWTTKEGLMKWWAVSAKDMGFDFTVKKLDVREGGSFAFGMVGNRDASADASRPSQAAGGHDLVNGGTYTVVAPPRELAWTWRFDIYLSPEEKPYDVPIAVKLDRLPNGGTRMRFTQGPLASPEHTNGSREGVEKNFAKLALALGE